MKQSKAEVIATKCLQHQCIERNIMHNTVYTANKMNAFNNLSDNEEHLNVSKVYQHEHTRVLFKNKINYTGK